MAASELQNLLKWCWWALLNNIGNSLPFWILDVRNAICFSWPKRGPIIWWWLSIMGVITLLNYSPSAYFWIFLHWIISNTKKIKAKLSCFIIRFIGKKQTLHKNWSFPLRISSVKVSWSHLLKKSLMENFIFCAARSCQNGLLNIYFCEGKTKLIPFGFKLDVR